MQHEDIISMNPYMLLSLINTELRDEYEDLTRLCDDYNIDEQEIIHKLKSIGYDYNKEINQFK